jgi:hypothetical protein
MAAVTPTKTRSDHISDLNRGPITSVWAAAPSCTETFRLTTIDSVPHLYSGHAYNRFFQPGCMPTGTIRESSLTASENWDLYYCMAA